MVKYTPINFTKDSNFIFDLRKKNYKNLIKEIENLNSLKPTKEDIDFLKKYIANFNEKIDRQSNYIYKIIDPQFKKALEEFVPGIHEFNKEINLINNIIQGYKRREKLTLKKLTKKFNIKSDVRKGRTSIYYIMKKKLLYKFLKTTPKTKKLEEHSSIVRTFIFIKSFIKCLRFDLKPIFLDESNFQIINNKLKVWRRRDESLAFKIGKPGRKNLILAICPNKAIYYELNNGTNKSDSFLNYFTNLLKNIPKEEIKNYFFIMDNCSIHLTKKLIDYYKKNNLKIITIVPYFSELNSVEISFRFLKQKLIKKIYNNVDSMISDVKNLIESEEFVQVLPKLFLETLNKYIIYLNKYISIELNQD